MSQSVEVTPLYFFSFGEGTTTEKCPATKDIDWDMAIYALSYYMEYGQGSKDKDFGPAEIQRNFNENCDRNMTIYDEFVSS